MVVDEVPDEGVSVDQHLHARFFFRAGYGPRLSNLGSSASKSFWISRSVSGEKASGAIQIFPMPEPRRCLRDLRTGGVDDYELDGGLAGAGDDDLFPALDCGDEFGEVGLGVMDVYFHVTILAK